MKRQRHNVNNNDAYVNLVFYDNNWVFNFDYGNVKLENDGKSKIIGIEDIISRTNAGCKLIIINVRHVPIIGLIHISLINLILELRSKLEDN